MDAGTTPRAAAGSGRSASTPATPGTPSFEGSPCDREAARLCSPGNPSRDPLECTGGLWQPQAKCSDDQRCEVAAGPVLGRCVAIMHECAGRTPDQPFCDGKEIHSCQADGMAKTVRACGAHQTCSLLAAGGFGCTCQIGYVANGDDCELATRCDAIGACDQLTGCSMVQGKPVCDDCPAGFTGTGSTGCIPVLSNLQLLAGLTLTPAFDPTVHSYRVHLPLTVPQLGLTVQGPAQAQIEVNGKKLDALGAWLSKVLPLGEHPVQIVLTSTSRVTNMYELIAERSAHQEAYLKARSPDQGDAFGIAISKSGETLVVGATSEDGASTGVNGNESSNGVTDSGAAYVFVREGERWSQQAYLKSDAPNVSAWFGKSVALDGDTLFVGEPRASPYPNSAAVPHIGSVYMFVRSGSTWKRTAVMRPDDVKDTDMYGFSMSLNGDTLVISAPFEGTGGHHSGAIYVASRSDNWGKLTKLKPKQPIAEENFGWAVAASGDTIVVGAHQYTETMGAGPGHAYVFERQSGVWTEKQMLGADAPEDGATFGFSVSIFGDRLAVGAPRAALLPLSNPPGETYLFQRRSGSWVHEATLTAPHPGATDFFGSSVSLSATGLLVCANGDASGARGLDGDDSRRDGARTGGFHLFGVENDHWVRAVYGKASNADRNDEAGYECLISADTVVMTSLWESAGSADESDNSAMGAGAVYVFR